MSGGCIYPIMNSYIAYKDTNNCQSLKFLSACRFIKYLSSNEDAQLFLRTIPLSMFKLLFQTSIKYYYMIKLNDDICMTQLPKTLMYLLCHWPHKSLYLEQVFPYYIPHKNNEEPYYMMGDKIQRLYGVVSADICRHLLNVDLNVSPLNFIQEIDLTGNFGYNTNMQYMQPQYILKELNRNASSPFLNLKFNSFKYNFFKKKKKEIYVRRINLIIGVVLNNNKDIAAMEKIIDVNSNTPGSDIIIHFKRIILNYSPPPWKLLSHILSENRCQSLRLIYVSNVDLDTFNDICEVLPQLKDLSLLGSPLPSLICLEHLHQLEHLSLIGQGVRGQIEKLKNLKMGLKYLKLVDCNLNSKDLDILADSHHVASLQQFDLYHCSHTEPIDRSNGLLGLCQHLEQIRVLQLNWCLLHLWSSYNLERLVDALKSLPYLTILDMLRHNNFIKEQLLGIIAKIGDSCSLKIIEIEYPKDIDKNLMVDFENKFKHALHISKDKEEFEIILGSQNISIINKNE